MEHLLYMHYLKRKNIQTYWVLGSVAIGFRFSLKTLHSFYIWRYVLYCGPCYIPSIVVNGHVQYVPRVLGAVTVGMWVPLEALQSFYISQTTAYFFSMHSSQLSSYLHNFVKVWLMKKKRIHDTIWSRKTVFGTSNPGKLYFNESIERLERFYDTIQYVRHF